MIFTADVQGLCDDLGCAYADTSEIVKLRDGTMNESYYMNDLIHLTYKGQNKIAQKLRLNPLDNTTPYSVVSKRRRTRKNSALNDHITPGI